MKKQASIKSGKKSIQIQAEKKNLNNHFSIQSSELLENQKKFCFMKPI